MNPTSDLVGVAWISTIDGISPDQVATTLPRDVATWSNLGFITVNTIAGSPDLYLPVRRPVLQLDFWAVNPNSGRPPWGKANHLAELIREHVEKGPRLSNFARHLTFAGNYDGAQVVEAILRTEPRRGIVGGLTESGDLASYARFLCDLELHWIVSP